MRALRAAQEALVLRRFPYGESSLVLHVLTPGSGKVALLAKGAYRASSGFFAVFDLFDTLSLRWSGTASGSELGLVTRAALRTRRPGIARDLERYRIALGLLELANLTAREAEQEPELFRWLEGNLELLEGGRAAPALVAAVADLALLKTNGLAPALAVCASCGARAEERAAAATVPVSVALGGRLCARCAASERARGRSLDGLPLNVVRVAESLMEMPPALLERTRIEARQLAQVHAFVARFLEYHLETRPRTRGPRSAR